MSLAGYPGSSEDTPSGECGDSHVDVGEYCAYDNADDNDLCSNACYILQPEVRYYKFDEVGTTVTNRAKAPPANTATASLMGGITQGGMGGTCEGGAVIGSGAASATDYVSTGWAPDLGTGIWSISF